MAFTLVYVSTATSMLTTPELTELLVECRTHNVLVGITGALLYQDGTFMQVIEGDEQSVRDLYAALGRDLRHRDLIEILLAEREREFSDWSMAFGDLSNPGDPGDKSNAGAQLRTVVAAADRSDGDSAGLARRLLSSFSDSLDAGQNRLPRQYR